MIRMNILWFGTLSFSLAVQLDSSSFQLRLIIIIILVWNAIALFVLRGIYNKYLVKNCGWVACSYPGYALTEEWETGQKIICEHIKIITCRVILFRICWSPPFRHSVIDMTGLGSMTTTGHSRQGTSKSGLLGIRKPKIRHFEWLFILTSRANRHWRALVS